MYIQSHKAFTMIELTFVIIIIGILSAIAIPRFSDTADSAYITKAQSQLASVRGALATERQKRILRGDTTPITDLSLTSVGSSVNSNVFDHFSADGDGNINPVVDYPIAGCSNASQRGCWVEVDATHYSFRFPKRSDGQADFVLSGNRLVCSDSNTADCKRITR